MFDGSSTCCLEFCIKSYFLCNWGCILPYCRKLKGSVVWRLCWETIKWFLLRQKKTAFKHRSIITLFLRITWNYLLQKVKMWELTVLVFSWHKFTCEMRWFVFVVHDMYNERHHKNMVISVFLCTWYIDDITFFLSVCQEVFRCWSWKLSSDFTVI